MKWKVAPLALSVALVATACSGGSTSSSSKTTANALTDTTAAASTVASSTATTAAAPTTTTTPAPTTVIIKPMFFNASTKKGGLANFTMSVQPSTDGTLRVDFSEDEVAGLGDQYRAAVWNAVTVATLLTGKPLSGQFRAEVKGYIDGPSAGALTTVGILSLLKGDSLKPDVTMTGTINPDGTVGPVGGIPEKLVGAGALGIKTVLIPAGQRNSPSEADGTMVDVVALGKRNGVDVREVTDVYDAYEAFTGKPLPKLPAGGSVKLDETTYQRLKAKADEALANVKQSMGKLAAVDPSITNLLVDLSDQATQYAQRAQNLETQGLQAGAFSYAWQAAAYANATVSVAENLQVLFTQGFDAYFTRVLAGEAIQDKTFALLDTLKTFTPKTLSDASVLMATYGSALDAFTVGQFGESQLQSIKAQAANLSLSDLVGQVLIPSVYFELAGSAIDYSKAIFDVGRDLDGPPVTSKVKLGTVAAFFRKASDANFQSFKTTVVQEYADKLGVNEAGMLNRFADFDADIALSLSERNTIEALKKYIGDGEANAEYAQLGFAVANFARNAGLVAKYYSNGQLDKDGNLVGVRSDVALTGGLDLGKAQLGAAVGVLKANKMSPALLVAGYEAAGVLREGTVDDKFSALTTYWENLVASRVLAYLGGFETQGLK